MSEERQPLDSRRLFFLVSGIFMLLSFLVIHYLHPIFHRSDDFGIISVASGINGAPDSHVIFTHIYFGIILSKLYSITPSIAWYEIMLLSAVLFSSLILIRILIQNFRGPLLWFLFSMLFLFPILFFLNNIHFTFAAALPAAVSLLSLLFFLQKKKSENYYSHLYVSILLGLIALILRPEVYYLAIFLFAPIFLILFIRLKGNLLMRWLLVYSCAAILCVTSLLYYSNYSAYRSSPEWKSFIQFFDARSMFTDYVVPYQQNAAHAADWSLTDYKMITNWFYADTNVFSTQNMQSYLRALTKTDGSSQKGRISSNHQKVDSVLKSEEKTASLPTKPDSIKVASEPKYLQNYFLNNLRDFWMILLLIFCAHLFIPLTKRNVVSLAFAYTYFLLLFFLIAIFLKVPPFRIVYIFLTFIFMIQFFFMDLQSWALRKTKLSRILFFMVFFGLMAVNSIAQFSAFELRTNLIRKMNRNQAYYQEFNLKFPNDKKLVWSTGYSASSMVYPFENESTRLLKQWPLLHLGSFYGTPFSLKEFAEHGIMNPAQDLYLDPNILLISTPNLIALYKEFVKEHYHVNILDTLVDNKIGAYRIFTNPN